MTRGASQGWKEGTCYPASFSGNCCGLDSLAVNWVEDVSGPQHCWHQGPVLWKTIFPPSRGLGGWFGDDLNALHLLFTLFLLLHQLHLRSSGVRSQKLGTPDVGDILRSL